MNFFPNKTLAFKLHDGQHTTLERLQRRTDFSKNLISEHTDKSFRGMITGNHFKIISSDIGKGAFCVLEGNILETIGHIKVEIHTAFKVLLSVILIMPLVGFFLMMAEKTHEFNIIYPIFSTLLQIVFLRFVVIEVAFRILSKQSLTKLRDVLDVEWVS